MATRVTPTIFKRASKAFATGHSLRYVAKHYGLGIHTVIRIKRAYGSWEVYRELLSDEAYKRSRQRLRAKSEITFPASKWRLWRQFLRMIGA